MNGKQDICDYRQEIDLLDGGHATLRPICPEDKDEMMRFFSRFSEETIILRFQYYKNCITEEEADYYCGIDYIDSLALVAEKEVNGRKDIVAVGRYNRIPNTDTAEIGLVVQDSEQEKGIGTQLLKYLSILAKENGIHSFVAEVLRINGRVMSILRKSDPKMKQEIDDHTTVCITLNVDEIIRRSP